MDLGFGSLIEKLEEYFGRPATTAFLFIVTITIITYCMKALYQAISSISTTNIAILAIYLVLFGITLISASKWLDRKEEKAMNQLEGMAQKIKERQKKDFEMLERAEEAVSKCQRMKMETQRDLLKISEKASEIERKIATNRLDEGGKES